LLLPTVSCCYFLLLPVHTDLCRLPSFPDRLTSSLTSLPFSLAICANICWSSRSFVSDIHDHTLCPLACLAPSCDLICQLLRAVSPSPQHGKPRTPLNRPAILWCLPAQVSLETPQFPGIYRFGHALRRIALHHAHLIFLPELSLAIFAANARVDTHKRRSVSRSQSFVTDHLRTVLASATETPASSLSVPTWRIIRSRSLRTTSLD
jgi:hypothetical protein